MDGRKWKITQNFIRFSKSLSSIRNFFWWNRFSSFKKNRFRRAWGCKTFKNRISCAGWWSWKWNRRFETLGFNHSCNKPTTRFRWSCSSPYAKTYLYITSRLISPFGIDLKTFKSSFSQHIKTRLAENGLTNKWV